MFVRVSVSNNYLLSQCQHTPIVWLVHVVLLHRPCVQLEARVADVEERLLEKELLHDQVRQITARLESKTRTLKPSSLSVAEKVS